MLNKQFHNLKRFSIFLLWLLPFISTVKGINEVSGWVGKELVLSFHIKNISEALHVTLHLNNQEWLRYDLIGNRFFCIENGPYYSKCKREVNGTSNHYDSLVSFLVRHVWPGLDGKIFQFFIRYKGYNNDDHGPKWRIRLQQGGNTSTTVQTTMTPTTGGNTYKSTTVQTTMTPTTGDSKCYTLGELLAGIFCTFLGCIGCFLIYYRISKKCKKPTANSNDRLNQNRLQME